MFATFPSNIVLPTKKAKNKLAIIAILKLNLFSTILYKKYSDNNKDNKDKNWYSNVKDRGIFSKKKKDNRLVEVYYQ